MKLFIYDKLNQVNVNVDIKKIIAYYREYQSYYESLDNFIKQHNINKDYKKIILKYMEVLKWN